MVAVEVPVVEPKAMAAATITITVAIAAVARGASNQVTTIRGTRGDDTTTIIIGTISNRVETGLIMMTSPVSSQVIIVVISGRIVAATTEIRSTNISKQ